MNTTKTLTLCALLISTQLTPMQRTGKVDEYRKPLLTSDSDVAAINHKEVIFSLGDSRTLLDLLRAKNFPKASEFILANKAEVGAYSQEIKDTILATANLACEAMKDDVVIVPADDPHRVSGEFSAHATYGDLITRFFSLYHRHIQEPDESKDAIGEL